MKLRSAFPLLLLFLSISTDKVYSQASLSATTVNFFSVYTGTPETLPITVTNNGTSPFTVTDVNLFHNDVYSVDDTAFTITAGNSVTINLTCAPVHNLTYADFIYFESPDAPMPLKAFVYAQCKYANTYYDPTQNKSHEALKSALRTLISTGTTDLGYNTARDKMYMEIDNEAVNGQGAAQNTLECIYTGEEAVGYTSRTDCQTNDLFNTEHTFPQSMFGSATPMLSDLHHLFPTKDYANSERANKPFGVVSSPSWTVGGSKSNSTTFEPRDIHKSRAARALFYMVIRYQDYTGFVAPQENILRQWCASFPPNTADSVRNADIFAYQHNRNPFIDHNEFFDRIASICTVDSGPVAPILHFTSDTLIFGSTQPGNPVSGTVWLSNQGIHTLTVSGASITGSVFTLTGAAPSAIVKDSLSAYTIQFDPAATSTNYTETLTFASNDPTHSSVDVVLIGNSVITGISQSLSAFLTIGPNPVTGGELNLHWTQSLNPTFATLTDLTGRICLIAPLTFGSQEVTLNLSNLASGAYLLYVESKEGIVVKRVLIP